MKFPVHIVAVAGLVRNEDGGVLLMRHPRRGWEFPGGQVEEGEDLITALKREVKEETGIEVSVGKLVGVYSSIKKGVQYDGVSEVPTKVMFDFLCEKISGELITSSESPEVGWFSPDRVLRMVSTPLVYDRMKDMLDFSGEVVYRAYSKKPYEIYVERNV